MTYQEALDEMYAGYMARRGAVAGLMDREFKDPEVIGAIARRLDLHPQPARTFKVTGSKGKGSTSRLIAHYLRRLRGPGERVALFVSPEEYAHTDRMTVDQAQIDRETFVDIYRSLRPYLDEAAQRLPVDRYLSPFGIFLLIALTWFREQGAAWNVLEIGRGGAHDEVGVLPADVAVITSILYEHPEHLGPDLHSIAKEKAAVAKSARQTIVSAQAESVLTECGLWQAFPFCRENGAPLRPDAPRWLALDDRLARQAISTALGVEDERLLSFGIDGVSAAWGRLSHEGVEVVYDAMVNLNSLDRAWFERTFRGERPLILFSLPDEKDRARIVAFMENVAGAAAREVVLLGKRGYLSYDEAERRPDKVSGRLHYEDTDGFRSLLKAEIARFSPSKVYCFGTQTYLRLVKSALCFRAFEYG